MAVDIKPLDAPLGARLSGIDLTQPIDDATFEQVRQALYKYQALVIRDNVFDDDDHVRFTERFGDLRASKMKDYTRGKNSAVFVVSNIEQDGKNVGVADAGLWWHSDGSFMENPHGVLALHALEVPVDAQGKALGDTVLASTCNAYDALPEAMKKRIDGLKVVNTLLARVQKTHGAGVKTETSTAAAPTEMEFTHPVARPHPITGRKCLYVSEGYSARIVGLPEDESRDLLAELTSFCTRPEFLYSHAWRVNDLLVWDNQATQHRATFDYQLPQRRLMHRTAALF